ncbi:hypothetical protein FB451DRAFT_1185417 [Mycena latifolia]|nr:hypothetical protein FB451DRAFT_1185417 [Mycena latifolia]
MESSGDWWFSRACSPAISIETIMGQWNSHQRRVTEVQWMPAGLDGHTGNQCFPLVSNKPALSPGGGQCRPVPIGRLISAAYITAETHVFRPDRPRAELMSDHVVQDIHQSALVGIPPIPLAVLRGPKEISSSTRSSAECLYRASEYPPHRFFKVVLLLLMEDSLKDVRLLEEEIESYRQPHGIVHQASLQKQVKDSFPAMYNRSREERAAQLEAAREHKKRRERKKAAKEREEREAKERAERAQQRAVALAKKAAAAMAARMRAAAVTSSTPRMLPGMPTRPCPGHVEQAPLAALVWLQARGSCGLENLLAQQVGCRAICTPCKTVVVTGTSAVGAVRPCAQDLRGFAVEGIRHPLAATDQTQGTPALPAAAKSLQDDGTAV